ncbi:Site-specific DNA recombinase [Bradyrhizobium sp. NFR13]|uniref:recombinase family protein n=1 Tax=Bradyrhizobium sp. NFR13 TaxID=1566285 RepID=UPI0008E7F91B|nr:recombinase family protein [Bradyrhizobium sp. NFR13]SFM00295.1 Site-specific DNA recombinase [Bradyrhizobium sp. NFR13]
MQLLSNRAVQYLRMSTDMQESSIAIQAEAIALFAARHGLAVVRSYEDLGRSGLKFDRRPELQRLVADVRSGSADFGTILIYDVSRWGRFQDTDESAYYEYVCRSHGVTVEYCAEPFRNDGSLSASILKTLKRAMAGEFSRELSAKVFAGQAKAVARGFHRGSVAGYGLRRCLIDSLTNERTVLRDGQRKRLSTDHVILVPGPDDEREVILKIYGWFLNEKLSLSAISRRLNQDGTLNSSGRSWNDVSVREILTNEKYIGAAQFNKTSRKLGTPSMRNRRESWIETADAYEALVPKSVFLKARGQLAFNARAYTDNELLDSLSAIWCAKGGITAATIGASPVTPCVNAYKEHFGGLAAAYERIGYRPAFRSGHATQSRIIITSQMVAQLKASGCSVEWPSGSSQIIVNEDLIIGVVVVSARPMCGKNQWQVNRSSWRKPDVIVLARIADHSVAVEDYTFVPALFLTNPTWLTFTPRRLSRMKAFRARSLDPLLRICSCSPIGELDAPNP